MNGNKNNKNMKRKTEKQQTPLYEKGRTKIHGGKMGKAQREIIRRQQYIQILSIIAAATVILLKGEAILQLLTWAKDFFVSK